MIVASTSGADLAEAWSSGFAAVGTVGAFVVGYMLLHTQSKRDRAVDAAAATTQKRRQASQVTAWIDQVDLEDPDLQELPGGAIRGITRGHVEGATVRNGSDEPVYAGTLTWAKAIDGMEVTNEGFGALGPGQTKKFQTPDNLHLIHGTAVAIRFRDASGVTWERDSNGILTESP